jgi:hypothetical protein
MVSVEIIWNYTDFDTIRDLNALPLIPLHTYQPANRQYGEVLKANMRVQVNGVRLFFEIEGTKLRLTENSFVEVPTLLLLHGGPGADLQVIDPHFQRFLTLLRSSTLITAAMEEVITVPKNRGI